MKMADVSSKSTTILMGLSFLCGIFVGYKIKSWRVKYLKTKREFLADQMVETQRKINIATGGP